MVNSAQISDDTDKDGNPIDDRDSSPDKWIKYEDDEDYDNIKTDLIKLLRMKYSLEIISENPLVLKKIKY